MNTEDRIVVCSRSFSQNKVLRAELAQKYQQVTFNDSGKSLVGEDLVRFLRGHNKVITALERIDESLLAALPELEVISKYGVGFDMIDMEAMRRHGKRLGRKQGVNRRSVSELVLAFAIAMLRHVPAAHQEVLSGTWRQHVGAQLTGKTVGIIGCGCIGKDIVGLLRAFNCRILAHDIRDYADFYLDQGIESLSLEGLLTRADIVTLHVPLDDSTRGMLDRERLSLLRPTAILINTARGGLVDELALKEMLKEGRLAGAAFDVFAQEPPQDHELLELTNFLVTPHIGGSAHEAILAMGRAAIDGLEENQVPGVDLV